jgi:hypothetical protein
MKMKYSNRTVFQCAMDVCNKPLAGWTFRIFRRGAAARETPIVILARADAPPTNPLDCAKMVPILQVGAARSAIAAAADASGPLAFVCDGSARAGRLALRFCQSGAVEVGAIT